MICHQKKLVAIDSKKSSHLSPSFYDQWMIDVFIELDINATTSGIHNSKGGTKLSIIFFHKGSVDLTVRLPKDRKITQMLVANVLNNQNRRIIVKTIRYNQFIFENKYVTSSMIEAVKKHPKFLGCLIKDMLKIVWGKFGMRKWKV